MNASTHACCAGTGGHSDRFPAIASQGSTRSSGRIAQPSRHPVMPQYFEKDEMTTTSSPHSSAEVPFDPVNVTPW